MPVPVKAVVTVMLVNVKGPWLDEDGIVTLAVMVEKTERDELLLVGEFSSVSVTEIDEVEAQGDDDPVGPTNEVKLSAENGGYVLDGVNVEKTMTVSDSETEVSAADEEDEEVGVAIKVPLLAE